MLTIATASLILGYIFLKLTLVIVPMRESCVVERLGKFNRVLNPGWHILIPIVDRVAYRHEIREQVHDVPSQTCISQDNIQIEVDGLVYIKVNDAVKASYGIENFKFAAVNLAQTTMRSEIGKLTLSDTFRERENLNEKIVREIDRASDAWGIKVLRYEIMNIMPSHHVVMTLEKQMEAERTKRAEITLAKANKESKILLSEGERQMAINLSEGEKVKRINVAKGKAQEISLLAEATAQGLALISEAVRSPGGQMAIKMQLVEQFIDELGNIFQKSDISVMPNEMANIKGIFEGASQVTTLLSKPE